LPYAPCGSRRTPRPEAAEIIDLVPHEQCFWPFYPHHLPDHARRLEAAIRWAAENGYEPVFFHNLLGSPDWP